MNNIANKCLLTEDKLMPEIQEIQIIFTRMN